MPPPPPEEEKPKPPRPKPPQPKPTAVVPKPKPTGPLPQRDLTLAGVPPLPPDPFACADTCSDSCAFYNLCPPPPPPASPATTVHISSGRLPTPLIALSASLLAVSAVLLLALLLHRLLRRRRRRLAEAALAVQHDEEVGGHPVLVGAVVAEVVGDEEDEDGGDGGVHHVWYIRTKGLDERAIAAIAAVVYDTGSKKLGAGADDDESSCAVCLAEFRDGETLRLLPRCRHAFHRGCIDTWLRAHVNCPLCRAPVQVTSAAAGVGAGAADAMAAPGGEPETDLGATRTDADGERGGGLPERAIRRAASMVALPRRAWPGMSSFRAPASSSGREEDMTGLGKILRILKFSDAVEMAGVGVGRSASFSVGSCQRSQVRSGTSAAGVSSDEMPR